MPYNIPIFLLKARSAPTDSYDELFSRFRDGSNDITFDPIFVPIVEHQLCDQGLCELAQIISSGRISSRAEAAFGGMVFTSHRAVEAFATIISRIKEVDMLEELGTIPIYSVGPATTKSLAAIAMPTKFPIEILGTHTGNGEALAKFIVEHYGERYRNRPTPPPLLFIAGEQRRDVIPRYLMNSNLPESRRIPVTEITVYTTNVKDSFEDNFKHQLTQTASRDHRWVVAFSPTGCEAMLKCLDLFPSDDARPLAQCWRARTFVATIGPTTKDYLWTRFGFEPAASADQPSPDGLMQAIYSKTLSRTMTHKH